MKTGDKVRFLHTKGEGVVKAIIDARTVEVEIEDGFRIPLLKNEVVVIAAEEGSRFSSAPVREDDTKDMDNHEKTSGIYLSFVPFNDKIYSLYLINNSSYTILFSLGEKSFASSHGIASGVLARSSAEKIKEYKISDFEQWPEFSIQVLFHKNGLYHPSAPLERKIRFKASTFYKSKKTAPVLDKEAFVYQVDQHINAIVTDEIKDRMLSATEQQTKTEVKKPEAEIDLHIENIHDKHKSMDSSEILRYQLSYFERHLENAIATGMDQIIFIHGVGNGVLKNSIHKKLSGNPFIKFFEDARRDKFGYGATLVKIK